MTENDYTPNAPENFCTKNNTGHDLLQQNFNRTFFPPRILTGSLWTYLLYFQPIFEILHTLKFYIKVDTCIISTITFSKSSYKIHYVFFSFWKGNPQDLTSRCLYIQSNSCYRYYKIYKCKQLLGHN